MGFSRYIHLVLGVGFPTAVQGRNTLDLSGLCKVWVNEAILDGALEFVA